MALQLFNLGHSDVRNHHFPQLAPFTTNSKPSASIVLEKLNEGAADLAGRLAREGLSAETLAADETSAAFTWCARYIRLYAAIGTLQAGANSDPEVAKAWRAELKDMQQALDDYGHLALGDAAAPATAGNPPVTHISKLGLETPSADDASTITPKFRRDDVL